MDLKCFSCGKAGPENVYLKCIHEGVEKLVCARCLPVLIHGAR